MKVQKLFKIVNQNVSKDKRASYYDFIFHLDECRKDLGYINCVDEIFKNIEEIFAYMVSEMSEETCKSFELYTNEMASWLDKDLFITYQAEKNVDDDDTDDDSDDETVDIAEDDALLQDDNAVLRFVPMDQDIVTNCLSQLTAISRDVSFMTVIITAATFINVGMSLMSLTKVN